MKQKTKVKLNDRSLIFEKKKKGSGFIKQKTKMKVNKKSLIFDKRATK